MKKRMKLPVVAVTALVAVGYALLFILVRAGIQLAPEPLGGTWVALGVGALIASIVCTPTLFAGWSRALKAKKGGRA